MSDHTQAAVAETVGATAGTTLLDALGNAVDPERLMRHMREFARRVKLSATAEAGVSCR